ncbi:MAG: thioredoxin [DPANN group archaeon]|nr:thioredoxin [DPANN group archaeon]
MGDNLIHTTDNTFEKDVLESDVPVIVDFWAEWCGPCKMMGPIFEELSDEYKGTLKFAKLDTENNPRTSMKYQITGIPTLLILKDGKRVEQIVGMMPKGMLKTKIDSILEKI